MSIEKVVLIEPRSGVHFFSHARMPLLGLPILGAILRRMNLRVRIFCEKLAPIDWTAVSEADLVGISALTNLAPRAYEIVDKAKEIAEKIGRKIFVVMGGPHPSFLPEEALDHGVDFVVRHEGEQTFQDLLGYLQGTRSKGIEEIEGLSYWDGEEKRHNPDRPFIEDLDQIPLPDFSLIEGAGRINFIPLQTSRGCPHDCEFCSVVQMFGRQVRYRSPENIVEELSRFPPGRHIFAVDDNFSADPQRTMTLLEALKRADLKLDWSTQERVSVAWKKEILNLMRETGCVRLYQGIESFNPHVLEEWGKGQTPEQIEQAVSIIHDHGLLIHGMFVFGGDADDPEAIEHTTDSAIRLGLDTAQFFVLVPPPGTRIYRRLNGEARIFDLDWTHYDGHYVVFKPKQMPPWKLQELAIRAYQRFYSVGRGVKWAIKGKFKNSFFAFYGGRMIEKWVKENESVLERLKSIPN